MRIYLTRVITTRRRGVLPGQALGQALVLTLTVFCLEAARWLLALPRSLLLLLLLLVRFDRHQRLVKLFEQ